METEGISTDKVEIGLGMNNSIGEDILETMQGHTKTLEERIGEESTETIIEMKEIEVGVGLEKDHFGEVLVMIIEGMTEAQAIVADQGLVQGQSQIEIELGATNVENMIILQKIAPHPKKKEN